MPEELDTRWMPACQCGWTFYASVKTLRIGRPHRRLPPGPGARSRHNAAS